MNTTAKIIITLLTALVVFFGIYSFIKANEADKVYKMLLEEQQISLKEAARSKVLAEQAATTAAEAIESAAKAEMAKRELEICQGKK
jgi:choline-glycine betaine transporter